MFAVQSGKTFFPIKSFVWIYSIIYNFHATASSVQSMQIQIALGIEFIRNFPYSDGILLLDLYNFSSWWWYRGNHSLSPIYSLFSVFMKNCLWQLSAEMLLKRWEMKEKKKETEKRYIKMLNPTSFILNNFTFNDWLWLWYDRLIAFSSLSTRFYQMHIFRMTEQLSVLHLYRQSFTVVFTHPNQIQYDLLLIWDMAQ